MKWVAWVLLLPSFAFAQGVKVNAYDNFLKKQCIEIEPVTVYASSGAKLAITFSSEASDIYIHLSGSGWGAATIDDGNDLIFLFTNDSTVTAKSTGLQTFRAGLKSSYSHQYAVKYQDLQLFSKYELAGIRRYSFKEFFELKVPKEATQNSKSHLPFFLMN